MVDGRGGGDQQRAGVRGGARQLAARRRPFHHRLAAAVAVLPEAAQRPGGLGCFRQEEALPPALTVQAVLDRSLDEPRAVERRLRALEARMAADEAAAPGAVGAEYGRLLTVFELRGGCHAEARLERALAGLGLAELPRGRRVGTLSGGESGRLRLALARLVSAPVDVLLLDEPTNHLSPALVEEVEAALADYPGTLVVVSHDRRFRARWRGAELTLAPAVAPVP